MFVSFAVSQARKEAHEARALEIQTNPDNFQWFLQFELNGTHTQELECASHAEALQRGRELAQQNNIAVSLVPRRKAA